MKGALKSEYRIIYLQEKTSAPHRGAFSFKTIFLESRDRGGARQEYAAWKKKNFPRKAIFIPELVEVNTLEQ